MAAWKYYAAENAEFKEEREQQLESTQATTIIIKKLLRHFKLGEPNIYYTSGRNHSCAGRHSITININSLNFHIVCHELAHVYQARKLNFVKGDKWHTKKHKRIMKRMLAYCRRKLWFKEELNRRFLLKPAKPELTKEDLFIQEQEKLKLKIKRYQMKLSFYTNKLSKTNKKLSRLSKRHSNVNKIVIKF